MSKIDISTDPDFVGLALDDIDENEVERLARQHMPIILPWHQEKIRLGACYQSRLQSHGNPWVQDTPFVLADLYLIPKILYSEQGTVATYKSVSTKRQCETGDHLSLGFGVGVGLPFLASASVKGTYDKNVQENKDSEKQSIRSSVRAGSVQLLRSPKLTTEAIIMLKHGGGYSKFCERYGDYYLAGYRIGGETGIFFSATSFASRTDESYGVTATLEVLFFEASKTWTKDFHEFSSGQSVKLLGYDTLRGQNWNVSTTGDGVQVFKEQTVQVLERSQSILDRVVATMHDHGLRIRMTLLLAPYNNAMRLGQGFNSFSQQICVDDAVVADPDRAENVVTNDGTTMRILAQASAKPSAWNRQKEVVTDDRAKSILERQELEELSKKGKESLLKDVELSDKEVAAVLEKESETDQAALPTDDEDDLAQELDESSIDNQPDEDGSMDMERILATLQADSEDGSTKQLDEQSVEDQPDEEETDMELFLASMKAESTAKDDVEKQEPSEALIRSPSPAPSLGAPSSAGQKDATPKSSRESRPKSDKPTKAFVGGSSRMSSAQTAKGAESKAAKGQKTIETNESIEKGDLEEMKLPNVQKLEKSKQSTGKEENQPGENGMKVDELADIKEATKNETKLPSLKKTEKAQSRVRSSSVGGKHDSSVVSTKGSKPSLHMAEIPSRAPKTTSKPENWGRVKSALEKAKAEKVQRQREQEEAERLAREQDERERIAEQAAWRKEVEKEAREEERARRTEEREEARIVRQEQRDYEKQRREENRQAIKNAADLKALSLEDLNKIKAQNQLVERFSGMADDQADIKFDPTAPRGPSQTVIYSSRFVDRLSDITEDMCVSGSLSIKAAKIGGSGRGSFIDSDKFKESDLNFYISVKVINQTLNFKDALVFNPLRSVSSENFQQVYGDSFISGFLEGGEFNALVSMKILNKAKMTDIKAEAKVAFTAGPIDVSAEANVGIARSNIETNTETTIQVSWCGGGHIKPMEQQWNIQSLMQAAARFPDLVADCPQRTYAILTKYDSLRSFVARKPAAYTALQYENAQIYTNALMDSFMSYKSLYKQLGEHIFNIQSKTLEIVPWAEKEAAPGPSLSGGKKNEETGLYPFVEDLTRFEASVKGLSDARIAIRRQMMRIVNEVDLIEKDPKKATDEDHQEPFQSPVTFSTRVPAVVIPENLRGQSDPLTGKRIMAKTQTEQELQEQLKAQEEAAKAPALYAEGDDISFSEQDALKKMAIDRPGIGTHLRVTSAVGTADEGEPFNNLDFLKEDWGVEAVRVEIARGAVVCVEVAYDNGLFLRKGKPSKGVVKELASFRPGERVAYASLEYGELQDDKTDQAAESEKSKPRPRVLAVRLYTTYGRRLVAQAATNEVLSSEKIKKDGVIYDKVKSIYVDSPLSKGTFRGFFGSTDQMGIVRLGLIWGNLDSKTESSARVEGGYDYNAGEDVAAITTPVAPAPIKVITYAQSGVVTPAWIEGRADQLRVDEQRFATAYPEPPRMISGLRLLDQKGKEAIRTAVTHQSVTSTGFQSVARTHQGGKAYAPSISWLALPSNDVHFEVGEFDTYSTPRTEDNQVVCRRFTFPKRFDRVPRVVTWLYEVSFGGQGDGWNSLKTEAKGITQDGFDIDVRTWNHHSFDGARVGWLAFDDGASKSHVKTGTVRVSREQRWLENQEVRFEGEPFSKTPALFHVLMEVDCCDNKNMRLRMDTADVSSTGFRFSAGTWAAADDHNMDHCVWLWVAVE
ncbi:hypothetical protein KCU61_g6435, partial [Aureobasidium melanogenum]